MSRRAVRRLGVARAGRFAGRLTRRALRPGLAVVGLVLARSIVGTVATSVVASIVLTVGLVWWWARVVEPRLFATRPKAQSSPVVRPLPQPRPAPRNAQRHLRFAEALALVATRYVAECEREVGNDPEAQR